MCLFKKEVTVDRKIAQQIGHILIHVPESEKDCFGEDETYVETIKFDDGMEMDVKVCGVQFAEGEQNLPWTEAVLFDHGSEVACTEPGECFFGFWKLEYQGNIYQALLEH